MYVLKYMCDACGGAYTVAGDGDHLKQLLYLHIPGPPSDTQENCVAPFIQMGFPSKVCCNLPMYVASRRPHSSRIASPMPAANPNKPQRNATNHSEVHQILTFFAWPFPAASPSFTRPSPAPAVRLSLSTCAGGALRCKALLRASRDLRCSDCRVCGLKLASSVQLARSYHHICPVATFAGVWLLFVGARWNVYNTIILF
jgi:hypothetical protein